MRAIPLFIIGFGSALAVAQPVLAQTLTFSRQIAAEPLGQVQINNVAGSIRVKTWDRPNIDIQAQLKGGIKTVEITQQEGRAVIKVIYPEGHARNNSADVVVTIPAGSRLEVAAVSADVEVTGARGATRLQSVSGDIRSDVPAAEFEAKSVSGDITLLGNRQTADMRVSTVSGSASLKSGAGSIDVRSTSGDVDIALDPAATVHARSTSGDVRFSGSLARDARVEAETVSGDVTIQAGATSGFQYDASTMSGDISSCFGVVSTRASQFGPGRLMNGKRGEGAARVRLKSLSGEIELCDRPE